MTDKVDNIQGVKFVRCPSEYNEKLSAKIVVQVNHYVQELIEIILLSLLLMVAKKESR